ncbi:flavodoxin/nitric oxide synthase [Thermodesulfobacterium geofontis OPF15]|jgi:flavorubredoxin|uniref:Flavodoxin/nitric oxide synthase n=1 Tax=Thermodesulfobacterium geofontis (strain OPF15) TaxID=795359 RepID=F8C4D4_THEGP|nr:FprA family A-type flavoprotein [Thermodesulfobacterium geofontis]AEH22638.1 flavodoxin/nitric oxide synthase [Thermodesulfobacterium geofontis OPF15]
MEAVKIKEGFYWVGAIDWNVRNFHGYSTFKGTTYNSYLLIDKKITLFDTVKHGFEEELLSRIKSIINPKKIDYLIVNHIEPDHAGGFLKIVEIIKPEKIFITQRGKDGLKKYLHKNDFPFEEVSTGKEIKIGEKTIRFIETPMIHWPDSMISYIPEEKILVSQDAFGAHYATSNRFDDEVDYCTLIEESAKYYANIVLPYSPRVQNLLKTIKELGLEIELICPDHGVVWRKHINEIIQLYENWSNYIAEKRAVIIYDTMWKSTEKMAYAIMDGIIKEGVEARLFKLSVSDITDVMTEVMLAKGLVLGSPTLNNGLMPTVASFVHYMKGLRPRNKIGAAFGSYGWSGESVKLLNDILNEIKAEIVHEGIKVKFAPDKDTLKQCEELGKIIAQKIKSSS